MEKGEVRRFGLPGTVWSPGGRPRGGGGWEWRGVDKTQRVCSFNVSAFSFHAWQYTAD